MNGKERLLDEQVQDFKSSFHLEDAFSSIQKVRSEHQKLYREQTQGYTTEEERIASTNLYAYLNFLLEDTDEALRLSKEVLDAEPKNIIGLANRTRFLRYSSEYCEAEVTLKTLISLKESPEYQNLNSEADAELAYSYARCGPTFQQKAFEMFELNIAKYPTNYSWKFTLALTYRRQTHLLNAKDIGIQKINDYLSKAAMLFQEIEKNSKNRILRAQALCELGSMLCWRNVSPFKFDNVGVSGIEYFKKALEICPENVFVLERYGRQLRYEKELSQSENLLRKANSIQETPFNCHHLALTLRKSVSAKMKNMPMLDTKCWEHDTSVKGQSDTSEQDSMQYVSMSASQGAVTRNKEYPSRTPIPKKVIFSPMDIEKYPENPNLIEAEKYLKRAISLQKGIFAAAMCDLGIVYRSLDRNEDAIKILNKVKSVPYVTNAEKIRALEQIGYCKIELSKKEHISQKQAQMYKSDGQQSLFRAVALTASECASLPFQSFTNLRSLLLNEEIKGNKSVSKDLAKLHSTIGMHKEAIQFYENARAILENKSPDPDLLLLVESYRKEEDFDNALLLLNMMRCSEDSKHLVKEEMYMDVNIEAWYCYIKKGNTDLAQEYLTLIRSNSKLYKISHPHGSKEECLSYDIVVLCSCDPEKCPVYSHFVDLLKHTYGFRITYNLEECLPGRSRLQYISEILHQCAMIFVLNHTKQHDATEYHYIEMACSMDTLRPKIIVIGEVDNIPSLSSSPKRECPTKDTDMVKWTLEIVKIFAKSV